MSKKEYLEFTEDFFKKCIDLQIKKNHDYTSNDDPFSNFKSIEVLGIKPEHGFLTRMMDKIRRVSSFVENGELHVKEESVKDSLQDLANYACLLSGFIESTKNQNNDSSNT